MEEDRGEAIVLDISPEEINTPAVMRVPRRIRERLLSDCSKKTVSSVQDIEDKLLHAHLRRQQFYHNVSRKARAKPRSPSRSSDEELGQRIEARLLAAEQKRLEILAKAQMRLAKLDELRQAAKTSVEIRSERERVKLGTQVESRVQKAEANRMKILKASHQKRACAKERTSQSMMRRMARESKYKERVRASINQKRVAAEKKRLGLLEAEKKKARARVQQVRHVANSVSNQREMERSKMRDKLEDKLQRAKRYRSEFLRQRRRQRDSISLYCDMMQEDADLLSRKLSRCWRCFVRQKRTTLDLAKAYDGLKISESLPFEQLAVLIESPNTLKTVKSLLDRLEVRLEASKNVIIASQSSILDNIDHLLRRVATPRRKATPSTLRSRKGNKVSSVRNVAGTSVKMSRYPVRVVLSAFMILGHPDAVFNGQGDQEAALNNAAKGFVRELKLLINVIQEGPIQVSGGESKHRTLRSQLDLFDKAWCSFLNSFVIWKVKDARLLEDDLVRAACQLELSMIQKCKLTPEGVDTMLTHDKKAIQMQVTQDQELLTEKVRHLSGVAGVERMESSLSDTRTKYFQAKENGSPMANQLACFFSPSPASSPVQSVSSSCSRSKDSIGVEGSKRVSLSLFKDDTPPSSGPSRVSNGAVDEVSNQNELMVNEFLHDWNFKFPGGSTVKDEEDNLKRRIKETMERAFWDSVMESMKLEKPDYNCISNLMKEVSDELCQMVPDSWKVEITETIDLDILSQLLNSGTLDIDYLGKMLEFALATLRKLSAPANDRENESTHQNLLKELHRLCEAKDESGNLHAVAIVKGIRFILEQIQELKREIGIGRITIMKPFLQGPAGFDYLTQAFEKRYGSPTQAYESLPVTRRWISTLLSCKDEWEEHSNTLSALNVVGRSSMGISFKTGGSFLSSVNTTSKSTVMDTAEGQLSECKGERVDLAVRLGLLKLVSQVSGLTPEVLPETFQLNLSRVRDIQSEIQKIVVVTTSLLIWRQMLAKSESETESMAKKLLDLLDGKEEAGLTEIIETTMSEEDGEKKKMMRGLLGKSLGESNTVYQRVTGCIYKAGRGALLAGNGEAGKRLVETEMKKVGGGGGLKERVLETARALGVVACVSVRVHGPWLTHLMQQH
ncbi:T-complex 11 [Arabidopsis suecica]|uniref:T-complex 11 n=1 Tax=Arabidopsis suecica TaxID=45249 RepID=A0A8T2CEV1_ARASU|nr:T-complex 11 [Arabidopsis suecica]